MNANPVVGITYYFNDYDAATGKVNIHVPVAMESGVQSYALAFAALLRSVSDCALMKFSIHQTWYAPVETGAGDVHYVGALFLEDSAGDAYVTGVPGVQHSRLNADGLTLNLADTDIAALVGALESGIGGVHPCSVSGGDLVSLLSAYVQVR